MHTLSAGAAKLGIQLTPRQLEQFDIYYRELASWNSKMNLTAITGYEEVQVKHFFDSLTVTLALEKDRDYTMIDIGTGAGFPGLPLKIWSPPIRLTLLEATGKKAQFLSAVVRALGLDGVQTVNARAEEAARQDGYRERFDVVVSRGLAPMAVLAELTLPMCRVGGQVIAQKKGEIAAEMASARRAIAELGGELRAMRGIEMAEFPETRWLVIVDKATATPEKYPRRPGIPAKRPIR